MAFDRQKFVEAVKEAKARAKPRNFTQTVEVAVNLRDIDLRKPENRFKLEVVLPHGRGKEPKIAVIADGAVAEAAKKLGLDVISGEQLEELAKSPRQARKLAKSYDFFIAAAPLMPKIGRYLGRYLGPRNKMPQVVPPTMTNLEPIVARLKKTVRIQLKNNPVVHAPIGTEDMDDEKLAENAEAVLNAIINKLERGENQVKSVYVKTTMGPAVKVER
ncbi:LSU ribosomal protein L1P [Thermococcus onnurineus NA1]|uniref:Large ribosomal subunit protein uL1 n=1 Tax=Thermococcus onnurineus (strain NA1) TaxID=523850 RepID=B6YSX8_THEON|nr:MULTISPECIES: 50S ribosomal protein L1 [Thermococcus]ACJ15665.1 LSU ribosomal protein L1P [Thermococcus onnurineus NA1]NJE42606.1 50S ribosomal protein L1 [Thermococcus sp. GR6]NJE46994.1 50S ribosomal protein L1 [Thermococcus sp. GR7]NJE78181.1 50S ribosomal protein L1 [Thermococcus sp. GR4]NJF22702.1 50S ribosomal protein L1 [Thermococcus sp. GR5]